MDACACVHTWSDEDMKCPVLSFSPLFFRDRIYQWTEHLSLRAPLVASMPWWPCCLRIPACSQSCSSPRMAFRSSGLRYQTITYWAIFPALSMDDFWGRLNTISGRIWLSENRRCNCHSYTLKQKFRPTKEATLSLKCERPCVTTQIVSFAVLKKYQMNTQCSSWFLWWNQITIWRKASRMLGNTNTNC